MAPKKKGAARKGKKKAAKQQQPRGQKKSKAMQFSLAPCTGKYVRALTNPWADAAVGSCIPDVPSYPSKKIRVIIRGSGATSGTIAPYTGFVWCAPELILANDAAKCWYTTSTYVTNPGAFSSTATGVTSISATAADFASAALTGARSYRLVACGIRVRYTGTLANAGGMVAGLLQPVHFSLDGATWATLRSYQYVREYPFSERWVGLTYSPYAPDDSKYLAYANRSTAGYMGIMIQSAAAAAGFDFEVVAHYEMFGSAVNDGSRDGMDPIGYAAALEVAQQGETVSATMAEPGYLEALANAASRAVGAVASAMSGPNAGVYRAVAERAVRSYLGDVAGPSVQNSYSGAIEL